MPICAKQGLAKSKRVAHKNIMQRTRIMFNLDHLIENRAGSVICNYEVNLKPKTENLASLQTQTDTLQNLQILGGEVMTFNKSIVAGKKTMVFV